MVLWYQRNWRASQQLDVHMMEVGNTGYQSLLSSLREESRCHLVRGDVYAWWSQLKSLLVNRSGGGLPHRVFPGAFMSQIPKGWNLLEKSPPIHPNVSKKMLKKQLEKVRKLGVEKWQWRRKLRERPSLGSYAWGKWGEVEETGVWPLVYNAGLLVQWHGQQRPRSPPWS